MVLGGRFRLLVRRMNLHSCALQYSSRLSMKGIEMCTLMAMFWWKKVFEAVARVEARRGVLRRETDMM